MTRDEARMIIIKSAKDMLRDYEVSEDAFECDPEFYASFESLLDCLGFDSKEQS